MSQLMGFEGEAFIGTAGSTGATRLSNSRDITYAVEHDKGSTRVRGDGTAPPIHTEEVVGRILTINIQMVNDTSDTALQTMLTAAFNGTRIALRLKDYTSGKGFDGDVTLTASNAYPLAGEQVIDFVCTPSRALRTPQPYAA
jgi:hypothetical protein